MFERLLTDIGPELHSLEGDLLHARVGVVQRGLQRLTQGADGEYTTALRQQLPVLLRVPA